MSIRVDPNQSFHVLIGQAVVEMSLDALDDAYHGEIIGESTLIWQEGLGEWLRLDVVLDRLAALELKVGLDDVGRRDASSWAPAPDQYFVLVGPDEVRQLNLDELDEAYRNDLITDSTLVWQPGYPEWVALAELGSSDHPLPVLPPFLQEPAATERIELDPPRLLPSQLPSQPPDRLTAQPPNQPSHPFSIQPPLAASAKLSVVAAGSSAFESAPPAPDSTAAVIASWPIQDWHEPLPASPWYKRTLAMASGALVVLIAHQHGLTYSLAQSLGQLDAYQKVVGEPDLHTLPGLEIWLADLSDNHGLSRLSSTAGWAPALPLATAPTEPSMEGNSPTGADESGASKSAASATSAALPAQLPLGEQAAAGTSPAAADLPAAAAGANQTLSGKKRHKPAHRAPSGKASLQAPRGSGNADDPMNGNL